MNNMISSLIPAYNVEKYLLECIESVLSQTYPAYEIILVNDGSTDSSGRICDEYARRYPFIKVFHKPNGGQLSSRQYAIARATGEFYVFLDSSNDKISVVYARKDGGYGLIIPDTD